MKFTNIKGRNNKRELMHVLSLWLALKKKKDKTEWRVHMLVGCCPLVSFVTRYII